MNANYVIMNNHAYVFSNNGTLIKSLTDNLEEVLNQENKIEFIEEELQKNKELILKETKELKKDKKDAILGFPCFFLFGLLFTYGLSIGKNNLLVLETWNIKSLLINFGIFSGGLMGFGWSLDGILNYRKGKRKIKNIRMQNFFLEKNLENEKNYLKEIEELAIPIEQKEPSNLIDIDYKQMKEKLCEYKEKLDFYQKRVKKFYHRPIGEKFKSELYSNGIDAEIFEDYVNYQRSLKK